MSSRTTVDFFYLSACVFSAPQMESDRSIYFMLPTDHKFKVEQSIVFGPVTGQYLNLLLIHTVID